MKKQLILLSSLVLTAQLAIASPGGLVTPLSSVGGNGGSSSATNLPPAYQDAITNQVHLVDGLNVMYVAVATNTVNGIRIVDYKPVLTNTVTGAFSVDDAGNGTFRSITISNISGTKSVTILVSGSGTVTLNTSDTSQSVGLNGNFFKTTGQLITAGNLWGASASGDLFATSFSGLGDNLTSIPLSAIKTNGLDTSAQTNDFFGRRAWYTNAGVIHYQLDYINHVP